MEPEELATYPNITEILKEDFGTVDKAIAVLRFSTTDTAKTFFKHYDKIPVGDRPSIPIEAVAIKSGTGINELYGAILLASKASGLQRAVIKAANSYPEVMDKTIKFAKEPGGFKDRGKLHDMMTGYLPSPRGAGNMSVNIVNGIPQFGHQAPEGDARPSEADDEDQDDFLDTFPPITRTLEDWSAGRRRALGEDK